MQTIRSALDAMADFLMSVAGPSTPGSFQILLGQSAVFFTMVYVPIGKCCART